MGKKSVIRSSGTINFSQRTRDHANHPDLCHISMGWVCCWFLHCSNVFFLGSPAFLSPQKPTFQIPIHMKPAKTDATSSLNIVMKLHVFISLKTYLQGQQSTGSSCPSKAALSRCCLYTTLHLLYLGPQWPNQRLSLPSHRPCLAHCRSRNKTQRSLRPSPGGLDVWLEDPF